MAVHNRLLYVKVTCAPKRVGKKLSSGNARPFYCGTSGTTKSLPGLSGGCRLNFWCLPCFLTCANLAAAEQAPAQHYITSLA